MARDSDNRKLGYRIFLGVIVRVRGRSILLSLVPQPPGTGEAATDTVAKVGDQAVTLGEVHQQLAQIEQRNQVPKPLESLYARQILNQLVFEKEIEYEAKRLSITDSTQERADRIKLYVPGAFVNGNFVGMDRL